MKKELFKKQKDLHILQQLAIQVNVLFASKR